MSATVCYFEINSPNVTDILPRRWDNGGGTVNWQCREIPLDRPDEFNNEMDRLLDAALTEDGETFDAAQEGIDWQRRSPEDMIQAIQAALSIGRISVAGSLAIKGVQYHPGYAEIQKYARILAPPRVTKSNRPPDKTLEANRDWLMKHGDEFSGQWVALRNGQLIDTADTLKRLEERLNDTSGLLLTRVY